MEQKCEIQGSLVNFYDLTLSQIEEKLLSLGHKKFRAQQIFQWVYAKGEEDFSQMLNLSKVFREDLPQIFNFELPRVVQSLKSEDGTRKFLLDAGDGLTMEAVMIPSKDRRTLCVSSEVGCNMACQFCYTGKYKLKKRLSVSQIVGQFLQVQKEMGEEKLTNIVFMGMGEPLDNPEAVFGSIDILTHTLGLNLSRKKITVSTSGIVPLIPKITDSGVRLAVSLNAVDDEVRNKIMPINKRWPLSELLEACRVHARESKDKVTLEYVLLKGVTDSIDDAVNLFHLTKDVPCKINIIPFNEHPGSGFYRPSEEQIERFQNRLIRLGAHVLRRKTMGKDILAACGQLAKVGEKEKKKLKAVLPAEV